jgi:predicted transcriptional regulator
MKAILISIKPEWVAKILNGDKTIEIRKTAPKCDLPIDVYIYCAKRIPYLHVIYDLKTRKPRYILDKKKWYMAKNGKVVAKFTLRNVEKLERYTGVYIPETILHTDSIHTRYSMEKKSCLSMDEIWEYTNGNGYAWHISDLVIFDEPKGLGEFKYWKEYPSCKKCPHNDDEYDVATCENKCKELLRIKRPPQSWQYVEVAE